jgi:Tfp pilus assembly protein PilN
MMFWDKLIPERFHTKSEVCGLEVCFGEGETEYFYTVLKSKGSRLEMPLSGKCKNKLELPQQITKNKIPVALVVNGKGVVVKKISLNGNEEQNLEQIISQYLPALNASDFYIQLYKQQDGPAFIAISRKEQVDRIIAEIRNEKLELAAIFIGTPAVIGTKPVWGNFNALHSSRHLCELSNNTLENISPLNSSEVTVKIDDLGFSSVCTLAFAGGLAYLTRRKIAVSGNAEIKSLEENHIEKNKFRILLAACIAIAFALTVGNVIFYTSYFDKSNKLETELSVYQGKYDQINKLLNDYEKKKDLIENAGILNKNRLSEYADRIAKTLPDEVLLTEMNFNPKTEKDDSEDSLITFQNGQLTIKGNCNKSLIINEWVNVLKMQKFVRDVSLEKFAYNNDGVLPNYEIKVLTQ